MSEHVAAAAQVEIGMLSETRDRVLVGRRAEIETQLVSFGHAIARAHSQVAGVARVPVRARMTQGQRRTMSAGLRVVYSPDRVVKATHAAMQTMRAFVDGYPIRSAMQLEPAVGDAICVAAD